MLLPTLTKFKAIHLQEISGLISIFVLIIVRASVIFVGAIVIILKFVILIVPASIGI